MAKNSFITSESKQKSTSEKQYGYKRFFAIASSLKIENKRLRTSIGLIFIVTSIFIIISSISYVFSWQEDQDKIYNYWLDTTVKSKNALGKFGAFFSDMIIFRGFGIISIFIFFTTLFYGIKLFFDLSLSWLKYMVKQVVFYVLWGSSILGFLSHDPSILGGAFGWQINQWGNNFIGSLGTFILLIAIAIIFFIYNYKFMIVIQLLKEKTLSLLALERKNNDSISKNKRKTDIETDKVEDSKKENRGVDFLHGESQHSIVNNQSIEVEDQETMLSKNNNQEDIQNELSHSEETKTVKLNSTETKEEDSIEEKLQTQEKDVGFKVEDKNIDQEDEVKMIHDSVIEKYGEFDPKLNLSRYQFPTLELLNEVQNNSKPVDMDELEANKDRIIKTLKDYNIDIIDIKATIGPTVTLYEIVPAPGVRISKIKNLEDDIALSLAALGIRIIAPIPGKGTIGIEVPNQNPKIVSMRSVIGSKKFQFDKMELPVVMGKTITNETYTFDLAKMPHLLMAGATGQGKSVGLNAILASLLYKKHPSELKFVLVDPKKVELTLYTKIERHFLAKLPDEEEAIITDNQKVINTLNSLCIEMDTRYEMLKKAMVRNIVEYNDKFIKRKLNPEEGHKFLPYIVLVIDEFADLIMTAGKEVETPIARLAQLARAIGIHLIIATQRPSANIITGVIKANFPGRIAFRVASAIDSRTILDSSGADQLVGKGDMLISQGNNLIRVQCAFIDTPEVESICDYIGDQQSYPEAFILPEYINESADNQTIIDDEKDVLFEEAAKTIVQHQQGSASLLQRKMKIGYNRAGRLIDQLEATGIIGPFEGSKARQVLIKDLEGLSQLLKENDD